MICTLTKLGNGVLRFYRATDGMGIKGTIDRTILPVILDYLGQMLALRDRPSRGPIMGPVPL